MDPIGRRVVEVFATNLAGIRFFTRVEIDVAVALVFPIEHLPAQVTLEFADLLVNTFFVLQTDVGTGEHTAAVPAYKV